MDLNKLSVLAVFIFRDFYEAQNLEPVEFYEILSDGNKRVCMDCLSLVIADK